MEEIRYDAFISYRSTADREARRVKDALKSLGRGPHSDRPFSVFLDTSSLLAGDLEPEIEGALRASKCLVVLLAVDTLQSEWVSKEIEYWLANGGAASRLFLIRLDDIDLRWNSDLAADQVADLGDEVAGTWHSPEALPPPLRNLYSKQQKWIDLNGTPRSADRFNVSPIFARARGVPLESLRLDEIQRERARKRVWGLVTASMALLLVLAIAAGGWALVSRNAAEVAALEARAEASAAQSVLVGADSPVRAAQLALEAAESVDSSSVRAAMLAAVSGAEYLVHSIDPRTDIVMEASLSPDERVLAVVGGPLNAPVLDVYDLAQGRFVDQTALPEATDQIHMITGGFGVTCSAQTGSSLVRHGPNGLTVDPLVERTPQLDLLDSWGGHPGAGCVIVEVAGELLVSTRPGDFDREEHELHLVTAAGAHRLAPESSIWMDETRVHVAGDNTRVLIRDIMEGSWWVLDLDSLILTRMDELPAPFHEDFVIVDTDDNGDFLIEKVGPEETTWAFLRWTGRAYQLEEIPDLDPTVISAAAVVEQGVFSGVISLSRGALIRGSATDAELQLGTDLGVQGTDRQFHPQIVRLSKSRYLAVFASSAVLIETEPDYSLGAEWQSTEPGWAALPLGMSLGVPLSHGDKAVIQICDGSAMLRISDGLRGTLLVGPNGEFRHFPDADRSSREFTRGCALAESRPSLAIRSLNGDDVVFRSVNRAPWWEAGESLVVALNGPDPIEVYSLDRLNQFWTWKQNDRAMTSRLRGHDATGIGRVGDRVTFISHGRETASVEVPSGRIVALAPDSKSFMLEERREDGRQISLVDERGGFTDLVACGADSDLEEFFVFMPSPGFANDRAAASQPVPVRWDSIFDENTYTNCLTGVPWLGLEPPSLTDYLIHEDGGGMITTQDFDRESSMMTYTWTGWSQDGAVDTRMVEVEEPQGWMTYGNPQTPHGWSLDGTWLAVGSDAGLRVFTWSDGTIQETPGIATQVGDVHSIQLLTNEGLMFVTGHNNQFEIRDAATGFRLGAGQMDFTPSSTFVSESDGMVSIGLPEGSSGHEDGLLAMYYMTMPVGLGEIRELLCSIHRIEACERPG